MESSFTNPGGDLVSTFDWKKIMLIGRKKTLKKKHWKKIMLI
jgi:hypothetical protein